jgi:hypothetical protein
MFRKVLTREAAERVRRYSRTNSTPVIPTIVQMKLASEIQVAEALAAFTGLRFLKINPLELDLDVVTGALSAAFSRRHGLVAISKTATTLTVAVHDPLAPFPDADIKSVTGLDIERVVATASDIEAVTKSFYELRTSLKTAEKQLSAGRLPGFDLGNQEYLSAQADELDPAAQASFEQLGQSKEARVGFGARGELDEDVDVTAVVGLPAQDGTEQREAADAQGTDLRLALGETLDGLDAVSDWPRHSNSVPQSERRS